MKSMMKLQEWKCQTTGKSQECWSQEYIAATLYQGLKETTENPEEPQNKLIKDKEVSQPSTTTNNTRRVYNLRKVKNGNRRREYLHSFVDQSTALVHIALMQLSTKSGLQKYKHKVRA